MATKIKRKILNFGDFKKGKNILQTAEKQHPIKDESVKESVNETEKVSNEKEAEDWFLKNHEGSVTCVKDGKEQTVGSYPEAVEFFKSDAVEEAKKEKAPKEASIFKRNILDFKKFKDGKDSVQKEKVKPIKENQTIVDGKERVFDEFKDKKEFTTQELCAALKKEYPDSLAGDISDMADTLSRALENYKNPGE